ncbi:hypothetical protein AC578_1560 [Pseudocercospora eumusae]|uniref:Uncharacterized protein n=1 Tax=Pseudocercospora eumusae TaxID=321146 RepID=A0A139HM61_9PEZI|nr:hypothetical protein AC578_1560 [Pseudocercospora eumusae]
MAKYNFQLVKQTLTEGEKDRIIAIYLNTADGVTDWAAATNDFGAASAVSMKQSLRNITKKLDKSAVGHAPESENSAPEKPTKGKKRKVECEETKGKKRGRKSKKEKAAEEKAEMGEEEE